MLRIDSPTNARVQDARRQLERGERLPLEGARMLGEALHAGVVVETVFALDVDAPAVEEARERGAEVVAVSERVLSKLSELPSTRGLVALAQLPDTALVAVEAGPLGLVLDSVQDPANVGAILRSAEAFAASPVLLTHGCASPYSGRTLRASAGSAFRVPVVCGLEGDAVVSWARDRGVRLVGAATRGGVAPERVPAGPRLLVIGSEGHGISDALEAALDTRVTIPLGGRVESLNAAVAAALLLYALRARA